MWNRGLAVEAVQVTSARAQRAPSCADPCNPVMAHMAQDLKRFAETGTQQTAALARHMEQANHSCCFGQLRVACTWSRMLVLAPEMQQDHTKFERILCCEVFT